VEQGCVERGWRGAGGERGEVRTLRTWIAEARCLAGGPAGRLWGAVAVARHRWERAADGPRRRRTAAAATATAAATASAAATAAATTAAAAIAAATTTSAAAAAAAAAAAIAGIAADARAALALALWRGCCRPFGRRVRGVRVHLRRSREHVAEGEDQSRSGGGALRLCQGDCVAIGDDAALVLSQPVPLGGGSAPHASAVALALRSQYELARVGSNAQCRLPARHGLALVGHSLVEGGEELQAVCVPAEDKFLRLGNEEGRGRGALELPAISGGEHGPSALEGRLRPDPSSGKRTAEQGAHSALAATWTGFFIASSPKPDTDHPARWVRFLAPRPWMRLPTALQVLQVLQNARAPRKRLAFSPKKCIRSPDTLVTPAPLASPTRFLLTLGGCLRREI